ncbi:UNVERIFIED_CONTAM: hypothetical protein Slati_3499400 [Sesamum latifolium]|uniref:Reverse transcriptase n=1 Tax=Sesamum latifolium TaxID=2727402 RepID=A0AAW2UIE6_9LAMI
MQSEIEAFEKNGTWELVKAPIDKKTIGCRWVYKPKLKPDGTTERYKASVKRLAHTSFRRSQCLPTWSSQGLIATQSKYVADIVRDVAQEQAKAASTLLLA